MATIEITAELTTIKHSCGHTTLVQIDASVKGWVKYHKSQPCYNCVPTELVIRLCEHPEQVARGFFSPRAHETSAMQLCTSCRHE